MMNNLECCCCFDSELNPNDIGKCANMHSSCSMCIKNGVKNAVAELKIFKCPDQSKCDLAISEQVIKRFIDAKLLKAYNTMLLDLALLNVKNLHRCLQCDYAIIIDRAQNVFYCEACHKEYCFKCKKDVHPNKLCNEDFHKKAEEIMNKVVMNCCVSMQKSDACNKVTCPICHKYWCWYCKKQIQGYNHFGQSLGLCHQYNEPPVTIIPDLPNIETKEQIAQKRLESIRQRQLEQERLEREHLARLERERLAKIERDKIARLEREFLARLEREKLERERIEKIRIEKEYLARLERERIEKKRIRVDKRTYYKLLRLKIKQIKKN